MTTQHCGKGIQNSNGHLVVPVALLESIEVVGHYDNNLAFLDKRPNKTIGQLDYDKKY